ncbi:nuclear transport factor 2 family protein [Nocardia yunnanensis]|uniref:Nuclear transport factor 2 family protein n=1 Tax=Nocardia yunnanensis TaxID=2382165 RepID=A0A386ZJ13_9NOCA|nr:nuclear transport factor 2 family protein [Nocardia yunnanensis]AYF77496.1 nuclear transport factor 2 family protein [Nocardia yunnanensis]
MNESTPGIEEARMDLVETRLALRELAERYAAHVDRRRDAETAALFTADGSLVVEWGDERPATATQGRAAIEATMKSLDRYRVTRHVIANQLLDFSGDAVRGETYCTASHVYDTASGPRVFIMQIRYADTFAHGGDGWLFAERRLQVDWTEDRPLNTADAE